VTLGFYMRKYWLDEDIPRPKRFDTLHVRWLCSVYATL